ncbi:hypothetical protein V6N12_018509 [Hibiscus sabdariffa]|uniref:Uncharacterized protein n=1 Tax=Hibiscus sabdariffa TaxID=183260 RepID=A0ABR2AQJ0_9ROSI
MLAEGQLHGLILSQINEDRSEEKRKTISRKTRRKKTIQFPDLLRDHFRLSAISIAEHEGKRNGMEISQLIVACISDLVFLYIGALDTFLLYHSYVFHKTRNITWCSSTISFKSDGL